MVFRTFVGCRFRGYKWPLPICDYICSNFWLKFFIKFLFDKYFDQSIKFCVNCTVFVLFLKHYRYTVIRCGKALEVVFCEPPLRNKFKLTNPVYEIFTFLIFSICQLTRISWRVFDIFFFLKKPTMNISM